MAPPTNCDISPMVLAGRNISLARPQANIDFTVAYVTLGFLFDFACLVAWFYFKHRYERTRVRPSAFIILAVLASVCQMCYGAMFTIFNDGYPCWLGPLFLVFAIPLAAVSIVGRLILFAFLSQFSATASDKLKQQQRDMEEIVSDSGTADTRPPTLGFATRAWLITKRVAYPTAAVRTDEELHVLKYLITTPGIALLVIGLSAPVFLIIILYILLSPDWPVYRDCSGCGISSQVSAITLAFMFLFWAMGVVDWMLLRRTFATEDTWGLKRECFTSLIAVVIVILAFILLTFDQSRIYPYSHMFMLSLGLWGLVFVQTVWQLVLAQRAERDLKRVENHPEDGGQAIKINLAMLDRVLQDETLCAKFEAHLVHEFAVESLYFVKDVRAWQSTFHAISASARTARARKICKNYIVTSGLYSVNISSQANAQIQTALANSGAMDVPVDLFDQALVEINAMLIDGPLIRFYQRNQKLGGQVIKVMDL